MLLELEVVVAEWLLTVTSMMIFDPDEWFSDGGRLMSTRQPTSMVIALANATLVKVVFSIKIPFGKAKRGNPLGHIALLKLFSVTVTNDWS